MSKDLVPCHRLIMGVSSLDFQTPFRRGFFFCCGPLPNQAGGRIGVALLRISPCLMPVLRSPRVVVPSVLGC
jgi:hypothetical protein